MPVTAKLSRRFYEALGDDVANELVDWFNMVDSTYRTDLRELNELNYARFDAKVEQRFAESDARLEKRLTETEAKFERLLADLEIRVEKRLETFDVKMTQRFAQIDQRFAQIDQRFAENDRRFATIDTRFAEADTKLEQRLGELRADLIKWMFIFWATTSLSVLGMLKL